MNLVDPVKEMKTELIQCGVFSDARGMMRFCNDLDMSRVKRFYTISNSPEQPVRGWIGHKKETKWFFPVRGRTVIFIERFNAEKQSGGEAERETNRVELEAGRPEVLMVPPGNWFCIRQDGDAEVMVFSDSRVGEFEGDDFRREFFNAAGKI